MRTGFSSLKDEFSLEPQDGRMNDCCDCLAPYLRSGCLLPGVPGDLYGGVEKNKNISSMTKDDLHMQQSNLLKSLKTNIGFQSYEEKEIEATSSCVCA